MTDRQSKVGVAVEDRERERARELFWACVSSVAAQSEPDQVNARLGEGVDWSYLIDMAQRHALVPILYHWLQRFDTSLIPPKYLRQLKTTYQDNAARNVVLIDELVSIAREFGASGIDCLPFKGPMLGRAAYGDLGLRQSADLDIVVLPTNIMKARDCLVARGYHPVKDLDQRQEQLLIRNQHNIQFERGGGRLVVELHWRLAPELFALGMSAEELWVQLESSTEGGVELKSLPSEPLLLALCVHGARHLWERMSWVCDIAALTSREREFDWAKLLRLAQATGAERMVLLGLRLAHDFAGASLPKEVEDLIAADIAVNSLAGAIAEKVFAEDPSFTYFQTMRHQMLLRRHWRARARFLRFAFAPNEEDFRIGSVPTILNFVYYAFRPWRLLAKWTNKRQSRKWSHKSGGDLISS